MAPKSIPTRWEPYIPIGSPVRGTRFIAFKVPLKETVCNRLAPKHRWTVDILLSSYREIGMVVDLTMTDRYYDYMDIVNKGVDYCKIPLPGQQLPPEHMVKRFFAAVDFYLDRHRDDTLIGIHCTHGVNRTGYMIAKYLIQRMGYSVSDALECITVARGHPIERDLYISNLGRKVQLLPKFCDGKDIIRGRSGEEAHRKGTQLPDKGKDEHSSRHGPARDNYRRDWNAPGKSVSPWEPGHGPQAAGEQREDSFLRPQRSEFVEDSPFQPAPTVGYWGGGVHDQPPFQQGLTDPTPSPSLGFTGFNPIMPPPISAFPQQQPFNGHGHNDFIREEPNQWNPSTQQRRYDGPKHDFPHQSRLPPAGWKGSSNQGRQSPLKHRMSPPRCRTSPGFRERGSPQRMSPVHLRKSPPRRSRMSPPQRRRMTPPHGSRMSPSLPRRMFPPQGSPPQRRELLGQRFSPGRRMSPLRGTRGQSPPPPPRSFRTPPPSRKSPIGSPSRRHDPLRNNSPHSFRPTYTRGGPMTPPYHSSHPENFPSRGRRLDTPERTLSPTRNHEPLFSTRSFEPKRNDMPFQFKGRRSPQHSSDRGRTDHLDMKYGTEIEPFPLERSPPRYGGRSDSRTRKSRSPLRRRDPGRKPSPPSVRKSPFMKRSLSPPRFELRNEIGGGRRQRVSPHFDQDVRRDWREPHGMKRSMDHTDLRSSRSHSNDDRLPSSESGRYSRQPGNKVARNMKRPRTPEEVTRGLGTPEREVKKRWDRTPESHMVSRDKQSSERHMEGRQCREPRFGRPHALQNNPVRMRSPTLLDEPRNREWSPEIEMSRKGEFRSPKSHLQYTESRGSEFMDLGKRSPLLEDMPKSRTGSPLHGDSRRRGMQSPDRMDSFGNPELHGDFADQYQSPPPESFDDPRSYGVLRTPEPLEEEHSRHGPERFEYKDHHVNPRHERAFFSTNRRPYYSRGRISGRGRGRPFKRNYNDRMRGPHRGNYQEYASRRSTSPIVVDREANEEPDCRELLIEKRTTVAAEIGSLSPTALELIGPDDEILLIGNSSEQGHSRSSSIRRRPASSRLSPRLPGRRSCSPRPKKPVFDRLDDSKIPIFERLDDPEPRPSMGLTLQEQFESQNRGRYNVHDHLRGETSGRPTNYDQSTQSRASHQGIRPSVRGKSPSHGLPSSRGAASSRQSTSRGKVARGGISSRLGVSSTAATKNSAKAPENFRAAPNTSRVSQGPARKSEQPSGKSVIKAAKTVVKTTTGKTTVKKVSTKVVGKVATKVVSNTAKKSPTKITRGVPRGRR